MMTAETDTGSVAEKCWSCRCVSTEGRKRLPWLLRVLALPVYLPVLACFGLLTSRETIHYSIPPVSPVPLMGLIHGHYCNSCRSSQQGKLMAIVILEAIVVAMVIVVILWKTGISLL